MTDDKVKRLHELYVGRHYYLQVFFQRPDLEGLVKTDKRYRYIVFNHVGLCAPYFSTIHEVVGTGLSYAQASSDNYLPENCVRILLPVKLTDKVREVLKVHEHGYSYCVPYVVNVLKDLEILPFDFEPTGVDELFLALSKYRLPTEFVKDVHKNTEEELIKEEPML